MIKKDEFNTAKMIIMYQNGLTQTEIAAKMNTYASSIGARLKKNCVKMRTHWEASELAATKGRRQTRTKQSTQASKTHELHRAKH